MSVDLSMTILNARRQTDGDDLEIRELKETEAYEGNSKGGWALPGEMMLSPSRIRDNH